MMHPTDSSSSTTRASLATYTAAMRSHPLLVAIVVAAGIIGSLAWLSAAPRKYEATTQVLVSPIKQDRNFLGISVLRDSGDPIRAMDTASELLTSGRAAQLTASQLHNGMSGDDILHAVRVEPQGESNVLAVRATAEKPELAAQISYGYASNALRVRVEQLRRDLDRTMAQLQLVAADPAGGDAAKSAQSRFGQLRIVRDSGQDPTLTLPRDSADAVTTVGTARWLIVAGALIAALVIAALAAFLADLWDRRIRDQDELVRLYPLPILSVVPQLPRRARESLRSQSAVAREAFRSLAAQLQYLGRGRSVLLTSASSGDGSTTASAQLALALADAGEHVIAIDFDLRKPELAGMLGVEPEAGLAALGAPAPDIELSELLVQSPLSSRLLVLPALEGDGDLLEPLTRRFAAILTEALTLADHVIVDSAPLGEVSDALRIAAQVDEIIVVARPRHTDRASFETMRDLLGRFIREPAGMLVIGGQPSGARSSYLNRGGMRGMEDDTADGPDRAPSAG